MGNSTKSKSRKPSKPRKVLPLTPRDDGRWCKKVLGKLRTIRRFTWTSRDGLEQFDKLRSTSEATAFAEDYFCNRVLFADHYLLTHYAKSLPGLTTPRSHSTR